jgi:hypothetical protein
MLTNTDFAFLKDKDLLLNIIREIHARGVVGEEDNIICLVIKIMLRFCSNAGFISSNVVVSDRSGSGKDWLVHCVCSVLLKSDDYHCFTHITEKVLAYYDMNWSGKVMHIKDPSFDLLNCSVFKTMAEGNSKSLVLSGDKSVKEIVIVGKPVMVVTSLNITIGDEALRRWDVCQLDTSENLTKVVVGFKLKSVKSIIADSDFVLALKNDFKCCSVVIPFSSSIASVLDFVLESRTLVGKLLDYIRASAVLHQFQRERDKDGNIVATWFDFEIGFFVFRHLNDVVGLPLSRDDLRLLDLLKYERDVAIGKCQSDLDRDYHEVDYSNSGGLYVRSIISNFPRSRKWIYGHLDNLKKLGLVVAELEVDNTTGREIEKYRVSERYFSLCKSNKIVFRSVAFNELKSLFELLDIDRDKLGLDSIFSDWLSRE